MKPDIHDIPACGRALAAALDYERALVREKATTQTAIEAMVAAGYTRMEAWLELARAKYKAILNAYDDKG